MKFADALSVRSVPQWQSYNLDYPAIKQLIKGHTTPGKGKAVAIPGRLGDVNAAFELQLFQVFAQEHDRLTLFAKSKTYEINGRLDSIDRQLSLLQQKKQVGNISRHGNLRSRQRLLRIELEILQVGQEIQNLSRFISTNRQALWKLVKNYQKWANSTTFAPMIEQKLFSRPDSFAEMKMKPYLLRYTAHLDAVRSPFEDQQDPSMQPLPESPASINSIDGRDLERQVSITSVDSVGKAEHGPSGSVGTGVDFDVALDCGLTSLQTKEAIYWVHQDNLVEVRVLLLQYLRYAKTIASSRPTSSSASTSSTKHLQIKKEDSIGELIFEIGPSSAVPANYKANKPIVATKWTGNGEAILCVEDYGAEPTSPTISKRKRRARTRLTDLDDFFNSKHLSTSDLAPEDDTKSDFCTLKSLHAYVQELLPPIKCMAQVTGRRSRFVGLENSTLGQRLWAALDENVTLSSFVDDDLQNLKSFGGSNTLTVPPKRRSVAFPHAILTIRAECGVDGLPTLMSVLDQSHLTERVYGYSAEAHAMILFSDKSSQFERPEWFSQLDKDIRRIPRRPFQLHESNNSSRSASYKSINEQIYRSSSSNLGMSASTPITVNSADASSFPLFDRNARIADRWKKAPRNMDNGEGPSDDDNIRYNSIDNVNNSGRRPSEHEAKRKEPANVSGQVRYWNEYDYPPSSVGRPGDETDNLLVEGPETDGQNTSMSSSRLARWLRDILKLHDRDQDKEDNRRGVSFVPSLDAEENVEIRDKTPLLSKISTSTGKQIGASPLNSYDTFAGKTFSYHQDYHTYQPPQRHRILSTLVSIWLLALGAGVFIESLCVIAVSNSGFSRIDDESSQDGVYIALVLMGVITGFFLVFGSIFGLLRVWITMRAHNESLSAEKRDPRQTLGTPHRSHSSSSSDGVGNVV